jgi:hypothetical protein
MAQPFSSDYYDTCRQHQAWWANPTPDNRKRQRNALKARLRHDFLFNSEIAVARADILDGPGFMQARTTPQEIRGAWLELAAGDDSPLTIFTNTGRLDLDVMDWAPTTPSGTLHAEPLLVLSPEQMRSWASELPHFRPDAVRDWKELVAALRSVVGQEFAEELREFWSSWIEQSRLLNVTKFRNLASYRKFLIAPLPPHYLRNWVDPNSPQGERATTLFAEAIKAFSKGAWKRGVLTAWLDQHLQDEDRLVAEIVRHWISLGICRARADANGTDHESISQVPIDTDGRKCPMMWYRHDTLGQAEADVVNVELPPCLPQWLIDCDYEGLFRAIRSHREIWLRTNRVDDLTRLAERIGDFMIKNPGSSLPEPSQTMLWSARIAGGTVGGLAVAATFAVNPPNGWIDGILRTSAIGSAAVAAALTSQSLPKWALRSKVKRDIIHQIVQTVPARTF